jgi:hypothetical protein
VTVTPVAVGTQGTADDFAKTLEVVAIWHTTVTVDAVFNPDNTVTAVFADDTVITVVA